MVLVTYLNQLVREGIAVDEAAIRGACLRLRPVLMTATTTALGLLPSSSPMARAVRCSARWLQLWCGRPDLLNRAHPPGTPPRCIRGVSNGTRMCED